MCMIIQVESNFFWSTFKLVTYDNLILSSGICDKKTALILGFTTNVNLSCIPLFPTRKRV